MFFRVLILKKNKVLLLYTFLSITSHCTDNFHQIIKMGSSPVQLLTKKAPCYWSCFYRQQCLHATSNIYRDQMYMSWQNFQFDRIWNSVDRTSNWKFCWQNFQFLYFIGSNGLEVLLTEFQILSTEFQILLTEFQILLTELPVILKINNTIHFHLYSDHFECTIKTKWDTSNNSNLFKHSNKTYNVLELM